MAHGSDTLLQLEQFGVAFANKVVLNDINLSLHGPGIRVLMGPMGTGKSTLIRTLAGFNDNNPSLRTWGNASYLGTPLRNADHVPVLVSQNARLLLSTVQENLAGGLTNRSELTAIQQREHIIALLESAGLSGLVEQLNTSVADMPLYQQRQVAILRSIASDPALLCVDEPTTGLAEHEAAELLEQLRAESDRRALLVVLHNQREARMLGGDILLLAGGTVQACTKSELFFDKPESAVVQQFVRSGSCSVPSPGMTAEELAPDVIPPPVIPDAVRKVISESLGPRGFLWLKPGRLGGCPRPGLIHDLEYDLAALRRVGVTVLLSMTETPVDSDAVVAAGMQPIQRPVPDMGVLSLSEARALAIEIEALLAAGHVVAVHCKAGLGRTGTVLASQLIWEGESAVDALHAARCIEPRWVQSDTQLLFLQDFAVFLAQLPPAQGD